MCIFSSEPIQVAELMVGNVGGILERSWCQNQRLCLTCLLPISGRGVEREVGGGGVGKDSASWEMDLLRGRGRLGWEGSRNSLGDRVSQSLSSELGEGEGNRFGDDGVSELHTGVSVESDGSKGSLI